ncbi:putative Aminotransferase [Nitrospira japonica]|uniref:Putative Aminotransferase n=1 Tax=Nitrospira japonica TaxID=1325564 RepID=A0A1W1IBA9_9BACT|nr:DegT/DnrJ/EryC1/StrS family aminotransferase [Nitrospira japonica]SLM50201.1 putative Aminotransferase [Nitrospira japonica]
MKLQRTLAPTSAPLSLSNLIGSLPGLIGGRKYRERLIRELEAKFQARGVFLVSSGKAALVVVLKALAASSRRRRVIIPAYTCFSVPSAIVRAGLEVVLCDVNPRTLDFDFEELERLLSEDILCVLPTHLFGLPADVRRVVQLCRTRDIAVVEDAAQALGGGSEKGLVGTEGDVAFFSLGRGKNLTSGTGGIIVTKSPTLADAIHAEYSKLPAASFGETCRNWAELVLMRAFIRPTWYWLPSGLPFLGLGETKFYTDFPVCRMDEVRACQLVGWDRRLAKANTDRAACAGKLIMGLNQGFNGLQPITHPDGVYLRLPVLLRDRVAKHEACARSQKYGAGVSSSYPTTIQDIPELAGRITDRTCPGAQEVVERLVTLPTHEFVTESDRVKIWRVLGVSEPRSRNTGARSAPVDQCSSG